MVVAPRIIAEGKTPAQWVAELAGAGVEISEPPCASGTGRRCAIPTRTLSRFGAPPHPTSLHRNDDERRTHTRRMVCR